MENRNFVNGLVVLGIGLLASSTSSFLGHFAMLSAATDFTSGLFDGLSVIAFCTAVFVLARNGWTK